MRRSISLAFALFALAACTAETNPNPNAPAQSPSSATTPAPAETQTETKLPKRGAHLFEAALKEPIDLTAEQRKTIETLLAELPEAPHPTRAIATVVRSGETDVAKIEKLLADAHHEAALPLAASLKNLHGTLTKEQRTKLVAAVAAHPPKRFEARIGTDEAKAHIHEKPEEVRIKIEADYRGKLDTFAADDFDAVAFSTPTINTGTLATKLSKLTPEMRNKLAEHLETNTPRLRVERQVVTQ
jgi:hypothetical protein